MAVAEKVSTMQTAEAFFSDRKGLGDKETALRFLCHDGGESPQTGDELPENYSRP